MQTVLITGGTGLIGSRLAEHLAAKGYLIIVLTRFPQGKQNNGSIRYAAWDIKKQTVDVHAFQSADFIIHLAGASIAAHKWTNAYKKEIIESRTLSSKLVTDTLKNNVNKVKAIISASAIGWYGEDKEAMHAFVEADEAAGDFLGQACALWEQSIDPAGATGIRVCKLRTGIVLSNDGGALTEFKKPIRFGIAAILGSGKQMVSWIHIEDLCRIYACAMENEKMNGSYNAVAPRPASNKQLTLMLARLKRGSSFIPMHVPGFVLKIILGKRSAAILKSATVSCAKIKAAGFTFLYPSIEAALEELIQ